MKHINLSFAACGFLGIYHLGAASALYRHGRKLLKDVKAFAGASAGSLVATVLLTAPERIEECNEFTYKFAEEIRRQSFGALTPGYDFMARLRSGMDLILPANAHELAHNRLHVSITNTKTRQNYLVSKFSSREDLIKVTQPHLTFEAFASPRSVDPGFTSHLIDDAHSTNHVFGDRLASVPGCHTASLGCITSSSLHLSFAYPVLTGGALVFPVSRPTFFIPVHPLRIFLLYDFIFTVGLSPLECKLCVAKSCSVFSALIVPAPGTAQ
uniref:Patatin like phospholipase domain containing 4 n=1 Tax=Panthera leo TaxID=9689 RepID=A0A8C8XWW9_PANLE